tara:strand:- start:4312 stop:4557 length:246 start_codon:yes stop_codon:yes gene_type:complete
MSNNSESQSTTYHDRLRLIYSELLLKNLNENPDLKELMTDDTLFNGLKNWFGTAPPNNERVKKSLKKIIDEKIKSSMGAGE